VTDAAPAPAPPADAPFAPEAPAVPARRRGGLRSWVKVLAAAFLAALFLRAFAFEAYTIPSSSMEGTLLVGDYLFVSKLHYGARTPVTLGLPFTGRYLEGVALPWTRLPGLAEVRRGDVVVFNFPPENGPLDRKGHYIKRVVGAPGDTVRVAAKHVVVNGDTLASPPEARQLWRVRLASDSVSAALVLPPQALRGRPAFDAPEWLAEGTAAEAARWRGLPAVAAVAPLVRPPGDGSADFPPGAAYSLDDFGPIVVPRRGLTVALDDRTWPHYRDAITRHEGVAARRVAGGFEVEGALTARYTFRNDYLFVMGDNRDDSADSRTWGFVPMDHVVGKAVLVYFSRDPETPSWAPRWERMLRRVE
jgi:signal peptidase I